MNTLESAELAIRGFGAEDDKRTLFGCEAKAIAQELDRLRESDRKLRELCRRAETMLRSDALWFSVSDEALAESLKRDELISDLEDAAKANP